MKKLFLIVSLLGSALCFGGANDPKITQRNSLNNGDAVITLVRPPSDSIFYFNYANTIPRLATFGPGFSIVNDVITLAPAGAADWNTTTNKPAWTAVFDGSYPSLTSKPTIPTTLDQLADGATNKGFTGAEKTKLAGIATAATANSSDAYLLDRTNHTSTQLAATISDFNTAADARVVAGITGKQNTITAGTNGQYYRWDKTFAAIPKTDVGLGNVDNTADTAKPVSTAQAASIATKLSIPTCPTSQYLRGDASCATFPTIPAAQVNSDWSASSGVAQILNKPTIQAIQRIRAQTSTTGVYTWTFPTAYSSGVTPVIEVTVEDGSSATWNHQITSISNTAVSIQLTKTTAVTILGISVLGIGATPQAHVHLTAVAP